MKNIVKQIYNKTERVLFYDKLKKPREINKIISREINYVLSQYFDIIQDSFNSNVFVQNDGTMDISFSFKASRILTKRLMQE